MTKSIGELFTILEEGVPVDDDPLVPEAVSYDSRLFPIPGVPEGALLFISPCFCTRPEVQADGGDIPHHVRFITFEE